MDAAGGMNRLFLDYIRNPQQGLEPYLSGIPSEKDYWCDLAERAAVPRRIENEAAWQRVLEDVAAQSSRLGTSNDVLEKMGSKANFVVTGQQPGVLGGPLHTIYKVATAIAFAGYIERTTGHPCVPLYWCGSDDTDFPEIRDLNLLNNDTMPFSASIPQGAHSGGLPVGSIGLEWIDRLWKSVRRFVLNFDDGGFVTQVVDDAFDKAHDHGELTSAILVGLAGGRIAVVDGRTPSVRRYAQPLLVDYIEHENDVKAAVTDGGAKLEVAGYHAQLVVGEDSGVFLVEDGVRKAVTPVLKERLIAAVRDNPENCSPGAVARNLVQDYTFNPVAVVLGPAEVAYRAQIRPLYDRFGIRAPVCVPRMTGTFLPPDIGSFFDGESRFSVEELVDDPPGFTQSVYRHRLPKQLSDAADRFRTEVMGVIDGFAREIEISGDHKSTRRIKGRLSDLRKRAAQSADAVLETGKNASLEQWPFLAEISAIIKPGGRPQERTLSGLTPYLFAGGSGAEWLRGLGDAYVDDLLDGRVSHIVYSSKP